MPDELEVGEDVDELDELEELLWLEVELPVVRVLDDS